MPLYTTTSPGAARHGLFCYNASPPTDKSAGVIFLDAKVGQLGVSKPSIIFKSWWIMPCPVDHSDLLGARKADCSYSL